jgi:large subunit ribosomal protein L21
MFAIVRVGGKQYKVTEKEIIRVEKVEAEEGEKVDVTDVLMTHDKTTKIGQPLVDGAKVEFKVVSHGKNKKVRVFKMKAKKRYRVKQGHRQNFTRLEVVKITA